MRTTKIEQLWVDAHTLRGNSQITFGAAIKKYGKSTVQKAMDSGRVMATWTEILPTYVSKGGDSGMTYTDPKSIIDPVCIGNRPWQRFTFNFFSAKPEMKMAANGEQIG